LVEKACLSCHFLTTGNVCPNCKSTNLSTDWTGIVIVLDPERSEVGKRIGARMRGRYAVKVR